MTMIADYPTKKEAKAAIGQHPRFIETSVFGPEFKGDGTYTVANRPHVTGRGREWFGQITVKDGKITKVT